MFDTATRNARILSATLRLQRATAVAANAEKAIARRDDAAKEVAWLKESPVKDGDIGQNLPSEDEINAYLIKYKAKPESAADHPGDGSDPDNGIGPAFSGATL